MSGKSSSFFKISINGFAAGIKLSEDCCKYATEGPSSAGALAQASNIFGSAIQKMVKERETLLRALGTQVYFYQCHEIVKLSFHKNLLYTFGI